MVSNCVHVGVIFGSSVHRRNIDVVRVRFVRGLIGEDIYSYCRVLLVGLGGK